ncbi:MAG TPA: DedA family protein [Candidatus Acidoferrales bacterium]|nr:DedA family protein [Candidatus Acidoferrales bacterium]
MGHFEQAIVGLVDHFGYAGLFVALILGNIGLPVGSELVVPTAGALTATGHLSNVWLTIVVALLGEVTGESIAYAIGRYGGVPVIERYGKYAHVRHEHLQRIHVFFERYGTFAIFICRFLPFIRGVAGFPAGIAEMNLAHFYVWTFLGSGIFLTALTFVGYSLGNHLDTILPLLHRGGLVALAVAAAGVAIAYVVWRSRARRSVSSSSATPG